MRKDEKDNHNKTDKEMFRMFPSAKLTYKLDVLLYIFLRKCVLCVSNVLLSCCLGVQIVDARVLCMVARVFLSSC